MGNSLLEIVDMKMSRFPLTVFLFCVSALHFGEGGPLIIGELFSCPAGWEKFEMDCYKFVKEKKTWDEARADCLSQQADLTSIHSYRENRFLTSFLSDGTRFWLGGRVGWSWTDGSPWDYENWGPGSPSGSYKGQPEDCLENLGLAHGEDDKGMWNDRGCTNIGHGNLGYVCKLNEGWTWFNGQRYKFVNQNKVWSAAWDDCLGQHADLVSIHSSEELQFVTSLSNGRRFWLGGIMKNGGWVWGDRTSWDYQDWVPGQPSGTWNNEDENCLENIIGKFNDRNCDNIDHGGLGFVCKRWEYGSGTYRSKYYSPLENIV